MTTEKYSPNSSQQPLAFTQVVNKELHLEVRAEAVD